MSPPTPRRSLATTRLDRGRFHRGQGMCPCADVAAGCPGTSPTVSDARASQTGRRVVRQSRCGRIGQTESGGDVVAGSASGPQALEPALRRRACLRSSAQARSSSACPVRPRRPRHPASSPAMATATVSAKVSTRGRSREDTGALRPGRAASATARRSAAVRLSNADKRRRRHCCRAPALHPRPASGPGRSRSSTGPQDGATPSSWHTLVRAPSVPSATWSASHSSAALRRGAPFCVSRDGAVTQHPQTSTEDEATHDRG
jgi:hypothetical protein